MSNNDKYEVIVVGGGHAGCEAASAAAKIGAKTLLLTTSLDTIGLIACSPSFGGPGRGHLLREIDAMGGLMPQIVDAAGIHFRHSGKDSPRWAPLVICDRALYHRLIKNRLEQIENLHIKQDTVSSLGKVSENWQATTITGQQFTAKSIVISAGTFLKGRSHQGGFSQKAGRNNEIASEDLAKQLSDLGFKLGMFRTGTGPTVKLDKSSLSALEKQQFDKEPCFCSIRTSISKVVQVPSYKTYTTKKTSRIGHFPRKVANLVFVQPEDTNQTEWFLNGLSMDYSDRLQQQVVNSVKGLERAQIIRLGYNVSYCYLKSGQLKNTLESKIDGLFFAGQVIGTNGYEEAAATGLAAGTNAALTAKKKKMKAMDRSSSLIGALVNNISRETIVPPFRERRSN